MRPGWTNLTVRAGDTVVKRYLGADAPARHAAEVSALTRLPAAIPTPALLRTTTDTVATRHVGGVPGQDLVAGGHAEAVLHACGVLLRRLRAVPVAAPGRVFVHGDFGPHNLLFDPSTFAVAAVVDWEWAHEGAPVEDLAWCEWIIRAHHPAAAGAIGALFDGYGARPPWPLRQAAAVAKCRAMAARPGVNTGRWQRHVAATLGLPDLPLR
ncbi:phosphotransferase family protein [Dactylosporangium cerinum]|uniref:Phosphotransferase family protein n=1 Tax=Dactylosporangium cerinum TaxID=1434730 RepID=A0ABV9W996_9ACTN